MAKIFKYSGYATTKDDKTTVRDIYEAIREKFNTQHFHVEEATMDDDPQIMYTTNCDLAECEKYFKSEPRKQNGREVKPGEKYRHFKGNIVEVVGVAQNTESPGNWAVFYICRDEDNNGKPWFRPYDMFVSEVDHEKYPDVKQKWRFEKLDD